MYDQELQEFKTDNVFIDENDSINDSKNDNMVQNSCYFIEKERFVYFFDQDSNIIYKEYLDETNINKKFKNMLDPLYRQFKKPYKIIQEYHIKMNKCASFYDKYGNIFGQANFSSRNFDIDSIIDFAKNDDYKEYYGFDGVWMENNKHKIILIDNYVSPSFCSIL